MGSRKFVRFIIKTTGIILAALVVIIVGLSMYTQTDGFRAWLRERVIITLREVVHGDVALEKISGDVWTGVTFHNLSLRDTTDEVLQIPQATITLRLLSQIQLALEVSTFRIDEVTIQSPTLRVVYYDSIDYLIFDLIRLFYISFEDVSPAFFCA